MKITTFWIEVTFSNMEMLNRCQSQTMVDMTAEQPF